MSFLRTVPRLFGLNKLIKRIKPTVKPEHPTLKNKSKSMPMERIKQK
jgi:hypothetical protein